VVFDLHLRSRRHRLMTAVHMPWQHRQPRTSVDGNGNGANPAKRRCVSLRCTAFVFSCVYWPWDASYAHQDTHLAPCAGFTGNEVALS
jgi:hypothetical protein